MEYNGTRQRCYILLTGSLLSLYHFLSGLDGYNPHLKSKFILDAHKVYHITFVGLQFQILTRSNKFFSGLKTPDRVIINDWALKLMILSVEQGYILQCFKPLIPLSFQFLFNILDPWCLKRNKSCQTLVNTFSLVFLGPAFVRIGQADGTG